jgi:hypothetical protein
VVVGVDVGPPTVGAGAGVTVTVGPDTAAALQAVGAVILLLIRVTAPVCARARPAMLALSLRVMEARAMMVPTKVVVVSRVAELPTCQNTFHAWAPLISLTVAPGAVTSVLPIWKMKTPSPLRMSVPVSVGAVV